jgi:hypothetical protein
VKSTVKNPKNNFRVGRALRPQNEVDIHLITGFKIKCAAKQAVKQTALSSFI